MRRMNTITVKISVTRRELADAAHGKTKIEITGEALPLPEEARLIAEAINKILLKEDTKNVCKKH